MPYVTIKEFPSLIIAFIEAVLITWLFIPRIIYAVKELNLTDKPGMHKIHAKEIPTLGGIAIFGGFSIGYLLNVNGYMQGVSYFAAAILMLFFIGLKDDLVNLTPWKKIVAEIGCAIIITLFTDLRFTSMHGFLGMDSIPALPSYFLTIFMTLLIINALNLVDGIDGLAASVGIISSVVFGTWFLLSGDYGYAFMAVALLGALLIFISFNFSNGPNKIFMGDSGSLVLGFVMAVFAIHFNEINAHGLAFHKLQSSPAITIGILIIPLFDTLRVILLRLYYGHSPFHADHRHIHHMLLRAGFTHLTATVCLSLFSIFIIAVAFLFDFLGIIWLSILLLTLCLIATYILRLVVKKKELKVPFILNY
jgi:UDP-GlcNAc:undecaprenyl-phosphate/decaprenyl-phosphate GlcNAc-1-phosphate transferase